MPKESYEGIKAAASQDIPISSLRVAAPRRRRRRQHVAAVALSAADTRRRMGAGLLRHRSGTVRVPVRPQRQPVRDGSRQDATRDVRVGALAAGNRSPAQRGIAALVRNQTGRFPSVQSVDFYLDLAHGSVESAATLLLVEDARQDERQYVESVLTHQRQQLAHMYSQPRPSALDLGRVDVATEKFLEGGGLGAEMVRTERDVAAVQDYIEQSKLLATDGRSATEPFVDPLSSTATPSAFVSGLDGNPALHEMVDAILQDSPFTSEEAPAAPALKSEASHVGATSALKKTDAGTPLCFINNDAGSKVISTEEHYEIPWFAPGTTHSVSAITGLSSPLTFETMRRDVNLHSSTPRHTRHHHFVFLGSQKTGTKDKNGNLRRGAPNLEAGETGASPREHASSHPHMRT